MTKKCHKLSKKKYDELANDAKAIANAVADSRAQDELDNIAFAKRREAWYWARRRREMGRMAEIRIAAQANIDAKAQANVFIAAVAQAQAPPEWHWPK